MASSGPASSRVNSRCLIDPRLAARLSAAGLLLGIREQGLVGAVVVPGVAGVVFVAKREAALVRMVALFLRLRWQIDKRIAAGHLLAGRADDRPDIGLVGSVGHVAGEWLVVECDAHARGQFLDRESPRASSARAGATATIARWISRNKTAVFMTAEYIHGQKRERRELDALRDLQ